MATRNLIPLREYEVTINGFSKRSLRNGPATPVSVPVRMVKATSLETALATVAMALGREHYDFEITGYKVSETDKSQREN